MTTEISDIYALEGATETPAGPTEIVRYYTEAGLDYGAWSPDFQMHFGYWRRGLPIAEREPMLREMNRQVWSRLGLQDGVAVRVADLGCGLGASARMLAGEHPELHIDAVTLVPWQVEQARRLAELQGVAGRIVFRRRDYRQSGYPAASFAGAWAIESACHAPGRSKRPLLEEAARILAPGARLVITDGFLKRSDRGGRLFEACLRRVYRGWALETFPSLEALRRALLESGFDRADAEEISWRIAPSVAHVPWVTLRFLLARRRAGERLSQVRRDHLVACVLGLLVGAARHRFGYYLVTARRAGS